MTSDLINYVGRYGGFCRDCADNDGACPLSGMPCDPKQQTAVIKHTIEALKYGIEHGFIKSPFAVKVPDVPELVRYTIVTNIHGWDHEECKYGDYVLHSQVETVIAAKDAKIKEFHDGGHESFKIAIGWQERALAAEAKLAQIGAQEPMAWRFKWKDVEHWEVQAMKPAYREDLDIEPLYADPVASDADLRAENEVSVPILKGVAFKSGDGWKSTTKEGDVCFVWNKELPKPYAQGQYNRVGAEHLAVGTDEFKFEPASLDEVVTLFSSLNRAALNPSEPRT